MEKLASTFKTPKKEWLKAYIGGRYQHSRYGAGIVFASDDVRKPGKMLAHSVLPTNTAEQSPDGHFLVPIKRLDKESSIFLAEFTSALIALEEAPEASNIKVHTKNHAVVTYFRRALKLANQEELAHPRDNPSRAIAILDDRLKAAISIHREIDIIDVSGRKVDDYNDAEYYMNIVRDLSGIGLENAEELAGLRTVHHPDYDYPLVIRLNYPAPTCVRIETSSIKSLHTRHDSSAALDVIEPVKTDDKTGLIEGWEPEA